MRLVRAISLALLAVHAAAVVHAVTVVHVRCAEHGEAVHAGGVQAPGDSAHAVLRRSQGTQDSDHHCAALARREQSTPRAAASVSAPVELAWAATSTPPEAPASRVPLYRLAPKGSPPAARS